MTNIPKSPLTIEEQRWEFVTAKVDKFLIGNKTSCGNLHLYESTKYYCAEICSDSDEYQRLIRYLTDKIKV